MFIKKYIFSFILLSLLFNNSIFAQLDNPTYKIGKIKGGMSAPNKKVEKPISLELNSDLGFKTANKKHQQKLKQKQKEEDLKYKGIILPEMIRKENYKKNFEGKYASFPSVDMDLGSFHTTSKYIYISSYDFGQFDGDRVKVTINGEIFIHDFLLTSRIKTIKIPLKKGFNKVEVTAINEGKLIPNTGYFAFFDDNRYVVKEGEWMLAKGAKVIAMIVRDEK